MSMTNTANESRRLLIFLRTTSAPSRKPRPAWFSKRTCAQSLVRAMRLCGIPAQLTVIADGPLPEDSRDILTSTGQIVQFEGGNNRRSFLRTLETALATPDLHDDDLIWFAEDDYLYLPDAFAALVSAANAMPHAYYALYTPDDHAWHECHPSQPLREARACETRALSKRWHGITHTTSTYGARAAIVKQDAWTLTCAAYSGAPFAHTTSSALQGQRPFSWRNLHRDLNLFRGDVRSFAVGLARVPTRVLMNTVALANRGKGRVLIAPERSLATHVESGQVSPDVHWERVSREFERPQPSDRESARESEVRLVANESQREPRTRSMAMGAAHEAHIFASGRRP